MIFSVERAAVVWAILERISGFYPLLEMIAPMYLKFSTVSSLWPFILISLSKLFWLLIYLFETRIWAPYLFIWDSNTGHLFIYLRLEYGTPVYLFETRIWNTHLFIYLRLEYETPIYLFETRIWDTYLFIWFSNMSTYLLIWDSNTGHLFIYLRLEYGTPIHLFETRIRDTYLFI